MVIKVKLPTNRSYKEREEAEKRRNKLGIEMDVPNLEIVIVEMSMRLSTLCTFFVDPGSKDIIAVVAGNTYTIVNEPEVIARFSQELNGY